MSNQYTPPDNKSEWLNRELTSLERAFKAGNCGALKDAVYLCKQQNQPLPEWANQGLFNLLNSVAKSEKDTLTKWKNWLKQYKQDMADFEVYDTVKEMREHDAEWKDIYMLAGAAISGETAEENSPSENTVKAAYKRVVRRSKDNPLRYKLLKTFKKGSNCHPPRPVLWKYITETIKAGNPKGIKKQ